MANPIALTMIVLYLVSTTLVGIWMVRRSRGSDDWSVAGNVIVGGVWNMWW